MTHNALQSVWHSILRSKRVAFAIIAVVCIAAYWLGSASSYNEGPSHGLRIADSCLDFGEAWEQSAFQWNLPIENPTSNKVEILGFATSCGCASITPPSMEVAPGETKTLFLTLDLRNRPLNKPDVAREFGVQVTPRIKGEVAPQEAWEIKGKVRASLTTSPAILRFARDFVRGQEYIGQRIRIQTHVKTAELKVTTDKNGLNVAQNRVQRDPDIFELVIVPLNNLPVGPFQFNVSVQPVLDDGTALPGKVVGVVGTIDDDVQAIPQSLALGVRAVATHVTRPVIIHSVTGKAFQIKSFDVTSPDIAVAPVSLAANQKQFRVTLKHVRFGYQESQVIFLVEVLGSATQQRLVLPVSCQGVLSSLEAGK